MSLLQTSCLTLITISLRNQTYLYYLLTKLVTVFALCVLENPQLGFSKVPWRPKNGVSRRPALTVSAVQWIVNVIVDGVYLNMRGRGGLGGHLTTRHAWQHCGENRMGSSTCVKYLHCTINPEAITL